MGKRWRWESQGKGIEGFGERWSVVIKRWDAREVTADGLSSGGIQSIHGVRV